MAELKELLREIIAATYDYSVEGINHFYIGEKVVDVNYWWTSRGEHGHDYAKIPIEWLDEGFDYKSAYQEECRKMEEKRKIAEVVAQKKAEENAKRAEYKQYIRLKRKFENTERSFESRTAEQQRQYAEMWEKSGLGD